jgi:cyclopropane fatty-acyl-phospholipid synthase-like methyltransferase
MDTAQELLTPWDQQYAERRGLRWWPNEELLRFLGRHRGDESLDPSNSVQILEVGCGNGANLWAMADLGYHVYGVDMSDEALVLAQKELDRRGLSAGLGCGSMAALEVPAGTFDAVVDVVSTQHLTLTEHEAAYAEFYRVLGDGGWFFSYHLGSKTWDLTNGMGALIDNYTLSNVANQDAIFPNNGVVCMPTVHELTARLRAVGFSVTRTERVIKTYGSDEVTAEYHVIEARK